MAYPMTGLVAAVQERGTSDVDAFRQTFGEAFLLYTGRNEDLVTARKAWQPTVDAHGRRVGTRAPQDLSTVLVHPLPDASVDPYFATVGRVEPNTIVLCDESVSVYHAVFTRGPGQELRLEDADSTNGTFVNDKRVRSRADGRPTRLRSNDTLRFGSVVLTFLLPPELFGLVQVVATMTPRPKPDPATRRGEPDARSLTSSELFGEAGRGGTGAHPISDGVLTLLEGIRLLEQGRYRAAMERLEEAARREPENRTTQIWSRVARARWRRDLGDLAGALVAYQEVLALDPAHVEALHEVRAARRPAPGGDRR